MKAFWLVAVLMAGAFSPAQAQLDAGALSGEYRYVLLRYAQAARVPAQPSVTQGTIEFDGAGEFRAGGVDGPYVVRSDGRVSLMSPVDGARAIEAGWSPKPGILTGMSAARETEFDWLLASRTPRNPFDRAMFSGTYVGCAILLSPFDPSASLVAIAGFSAKDVSGELGADGKGRLRLPTETGLAGFLFETLASEDGSFLLGTFEDQGVNGIFYAARRVQAAPSARGWALELKIDHGRVSAGWGSVHVGEQRVSIAQRWVGPRNASDYRGSADLSLTDGIGALGDTPVAAGEGGILLGGLVGTTRGSILLMHPAAAALDSGLQIAGDLDAASFTSGAGSPGQLRSLFGTGFAAEQRAAQTLPLPTELGGASVLIDGEPAPLLFVSPDQINYQVPESASAGASPIVVRTPAGESRPFVNEIAVSSPGVFSLDHSGAGEAIVTHADFSLVSSSAPATPGEVLVVFLTGLGTPPQVPELRVEGRVARITYAGRSEGFAGLDQINFETPLQTSPNPAATLSLGVSRGWSDLVTFPVAAQQ